MNAIALNSSAFNVARVIGPSIAGALIATVGLAACFYLNAASYLAVIVGLVLMRVRRPAVPARAPALRRAEGGVRLHLRQPLAPGAGDHRRRVQRVRGLVPAR